MNGVIPSSATGEKKTSLLITWLPIDQVLLNALRPFKARSRGRRIKELAALGAEVERMGFKLVADDGEYKVLIPASFAASVAVQPDQAEPESLHQKEPDITTPASSADSAVPPDALNFAAGFF